MTSQLIKTQADIRDQCYAQKYAWAVVEAVSLVAVRTREMGLMKPFQRVAQDPLVRALQVDERKQKERRVGCVAAVVVDDDVAVVQDTCGGRALRAMRLLSQSRE